MAQVSLPIFTIAAIKQNMARMRPGIPGRQSPVYSILLALALDLTRRFLGARYETIFCTA